MDREFFARQLKALRSKADLSQEELAQRLGVTAQSVSKWEQGANYPETAVLVPLARLLHVSTDELLANPFPREEWEERWRTAWKDRDHFALLSVAEGALKELPGDREWRFRQANEEYQVAALTVEETERRQLLLMAEGHFSALLRDHPDFEEAGTMLVQIMLALGRRQEAEAMAELLPHREKLRLILRRGEARAEALRQIITKSVFELLNLLLSEGSYAALRMAEAILDAAGQDCQLTHYRMNFHRQRAALFCEGGDRAAAIAELIALNTCAAGEDSAPLETEHFLVPMLEADDLPARRRWVLDALENDDFVSLREEPEFQTLLEQARAVME